MKIKTLLQTETVRYAAEELVKYIKLITRCEILPEIEYTDPASPIKDGEIALALLDHLSLDTSDLNDPFVEDIIDIDIKKYIINDYIDFKRYFYEGKNKIDSLIRNNQYSLFMIKSIEKDIYRSNCYLYEFYRHNLDFKTNVSIRKISHDLNEVLYLLKKIS